MWVEGGNCGRASKALNEVFAGWNVDMSRFNREKRQISLMFFHECFIILAHNKVIIDLC